MDGMAIAMMAGCFIPTWILLAKIMYKLGKIEQWIENRK